MAITSGFYIGEKILYQPTDNRLNINEIDKDSGQPPGLQKVATEQTKSIACMIRVDEFIIDPVTKVHRLKMLTHNDYRKHQFGYRLASDEKFRDEITPGFGTAFAVSKNTLYTAAHCVCQSQSNELDEAKIEAIRLIFNFTTNENGKIKTEYAADEVFKIKVKAHHFVREKGKKIDWAWIKTMKPHGKKPLELDFSPVKQGIPLYVIGHPTGLPAKFVNKANVLKIKNGYFRTNTSTFGGNSGSPVFDEKSKKVVAVLFAGLKPDYGLIKNYEGPGKHRVKARQTDKFGKEKCYLVRNIRVHLAQRIAWMAEKDREECEQIADQKSKRFLNNINKELDDARDYRRTSTGIAFIPHPLTIGFGLYFRIHFDDKVNNLKNRLSTAKQVKNHLNQRVTLLEADYLESKGFLNVNISENNLVKIAKYANVYRPNDRHQLFIKMVEIENDCKNRMSSEMIVKLAEYELKMDFSFKSRARNLILTYLHNEHENPRQAVAEARIKACYQITKNESAYKNHNKEHIKKIARYMVKEAPRINFEQAQKELEYSETVLLKNQIFILDQQAKEELQKCCDEEVKKLEELMEIQSQILRNYLNG